MSLFPDFITDCHTHDPSRTGAIISVSPGSEHTPGLYYSVGIHPWDSGQVTEQVMDNLRREAAAPEVLAIGECGLDMLRGASLERQIELMKAHIQLSEQLHKPLIVHCVRAMHHLLKLRRDTHATMPWVIHGFRGNPETARQLIRAGCYISLGAKFNPAVPAAIPPDRLLHETD